MHMKINIKVRYWTADVQRELIISNKKVGKKIKAIVQIGKFFYKAYNLVDSTKIKKCLK